jgi:hypothetical protein
MALATSSGSNDSRLLGACTEVLRARVRLEDACHEGDRDARASYFAALEKYFYAGERAAGRDRERDPDD